MRNLLILYAVFFSLQAYCQMSSGLKLNLGTSYYVGNNALSKATEFGLNFGFDMYLKSNKFSFYFTPEIQRLAIKDKAYFGNTENAYVCNASIGSSFDVFQYKKVGIESFIGTGFHYLKHQTCERAYQFRLGTYIKYNNKNNEGFFVKIYYQNNSYNYPYINNPDNNLFKSSHSINFGLGINP